MSKLEELLQCIKETTTDDEKLMLLEMVEQLMRFNPKYDYDDTRKKLEQIAKKYKGNA